jgi:predicted permease
VPFVIRPKQVFRRLTATPGFTVIALITIAAGVGANSAIFGVVESVLLKPLPYPQANRLISVMHVAPGINIPELPASPSTYFTYRDQNRTFEDVGVWAPDSVSVTGLSEPEQVRALDVTDGVFPVLGVRPALGRLFTRKDDSPASPSTAMLSYGYWQHKAGGNASIIGRRILIDGEAREIIGVLPQNFRFLDRDESVILPLRFDRSKLYLGNFSFQGIARLRPGVTLAQASADVVRMLAIVNRSYPPPPGYSTKQFEDARIGPDLRPLKDSVVGDVGATLWIVMGTIGLVLLIACANVANLLLVRAEGRSQELAIRASLGASRTQLAAEIFAESITLGLTGGVIGLGLAMGALKALIAIAPSNLPRLADISMDPVTVLFTVLVSLFAGALLGLMPVLKYTSVHPGAGLRQGGRTSSASRERHRARNSLVIVQVTLAVILLISSGLMLRTAYALTQVKPGFNAPSTLQTIEISIPEAQIKNAEKVVRTQQDILHAIAAVPGVTGIAMAGAVPMDGETSFDPVFARDKTYSEKDVPVHRYQYVAPRYFQTIGARLVAGRDYDWSDLYDRHNVVIISENLARDYWGSAQNAIGKQVRDNTADPWREVIGVVNDIHYNGMNHPAPTIAYWPMLMNKFEGNDEQVRRTIKFVIRSNRAGSQSFVSEVRRAVWSVNASLPVANIDTMAEYVSRSLARTSFTLVMLSVAAGMALLLGLVGIYGVIAYSVSQRRREIGVRIAVGAQPSHILNLFIRSGLLLTGSGVLLGIVLSAAAMRLMSSILFGVQAFDLPTYLAACVALLSAAVLASYIPSRRALSVDPAEALRAE